MSDHTLDILTISYNRAEYTDMSLKRLLDSCDANMRVWVWHNGDHQETIDVVKSYTGHPRFHKLHISKENKRLREPTNWFWENSSGKYVSKVDDDCLLPDGWGDTLIKAHNDNQQLGSLGCWRYYDDDFEPEIARKKIVALNGGHQMLANCWIEGTGYVMKRALIEQMGLLGQESYPGYCIRAALSGWKHGWYYPFIHQEHMDDPRSPYCGIQTEEQFQTNKPLSAINNKVHTLAEWKERVREMCVVVQAAHPDPKYHSGWRKKMQHLKLRLRKAAGIQESWRKKAATKNVASSKHDSP